MNAQSMFRTALCVLVVSLLASCAETPTTSPTSIDAQITSSTQMTPCSPTAPIATIDQRASSTTLITLRFCVGGDIKSVWQESFLFDGLLAPWSMPEAVRIGECLTRANGDPACYRTEILGTIPSDSAACVQRGSTWVPTLRSVLQRDSSGTITSRFVGGCL